MRIPTAVPCAIAACGFVVGCSGLGGESVDTSPPRVADALVFSIASERESAGDRRRYELVRDGAVLWMQMDSVRRPGAGRVTFSSPGRKQGGCVVDAFAKWLGVRVSDRVGSERERRPLIFGAQGDEDRAWLHAPGVGLECVLDTTEKLATFRLLSECYADLYSTDPNASSRARRGELIAALTESLRDGAVPRRANPGSRRIRLTKLRGIVATDAEIFWTPMGLLARDHEGYTVRVLRWKPGKPEPIVLLTDSNIAQVVPSPDGSRIALAHAGKLEVLHTLTGSRSVLKLSGVKLAGLAGLSGAIVWSPDSARLAVSCALIDRGEEFVHTRVLDSTSAEVIARTSRDSNLIPSSWGDDGITLFLAPFANLFDGGYRIFAWRPGESRPNAMPAAGDTDAMNWQPTPPAGLRDAVLDIGVGGDRRTFTPAMDADYEAVLGSGVARVAWEGPFGPEQGDGLIFVSGWGGIDPVLIPHYHGLELMAVSPDQRESVIRDWRGGFYRGHVPR